MMNDVDAVEAERRDDVSSVPLMRFPNVNGWLPLIYLVILGGGWGLHFSLIKIAAESGLSYSGIAAVTTVGAAGLLLLIAIYPVVMETVADFDSD